MGHQKSGFTLIELVATLGLSSLMLLGLTAAGSWVARQSANGRLSPAQHNLAQAVVTLSGIADEICVIESLNGTEVHYLDQMGRRKRLHAEGTRVLREADVLVLRIRIESELGVPTAREAVTQVESGLQRILTFELVGQRAGGDGEVILRSTRIVRFRFRPHAGDSP